MIVVQNKDKYDLVSYKNDYGIPVIFSAYYSDGFNLNDQIVFVVEDDIITKEPWTITSDKFEFELAFTEEEAKKLSVSRYSYSFKQYRQGEYLDTIMDGEIIIRKTVVWQQD